MDIQAYSINSISISAMISSLPLVQDTASSLVNADRSALFLVDEENGELYAHMFSVPAEEKDCVNWVQHEQRHHTSVQDYLNQINCTLKNVVAFKGECIRSAIFFQTIIIHRDTHDIIVLSH